MKRKPRKRPLPMAALLLFAAGVFLVVRTWGAVGEVLNAPTSASARPALDRVASVETAQDRDALVEATGTPKRDPFHAPPRPRTTQRTETKTEPETVRPPQLRMILFDDVSPEVEIQVDGQLSGRLKIGQSYRGWVVQSISQTMVVVSRDGEPHTLRLRR